MEMWKRNSSPGLQLFTYKELRKNVLKINLLLLWTIFSFLIGLFKFLVIISLVTWRLAHNVKKMMFSHSEQNW